MAFICLQIFASLRVIFDSGFLLTKRVCFSFLEFWFHLV